MFPTCKLGLLRLVKFFEQFYQTHLKMPQSEFFDEDSRYFFKSFYFFGFYHPEPSRLRKIYGIIMFIVLCGTNFLGLIKYLYLAYRDDNQLAIKLHLMMALSTFSLVIQVGVVIRYQSLIKDMMDSFFWMHKENDEDSGFKCITLRRFGKIQKYILRAGTFGFLVLKLTGNLPAYHLFGPVIYDELAHGFWYYPFLFTNFLHGVCYVELFAAGDNLIILFIVKLLHNLDILGEKILLNA